jgi:tetratricopeptide (TPR) repeat protein
MTQRGLGCSDYAVQLSGSDPLVWIIRGEILSLAENKNALHCFEKAMEMRQSDDWQTPMQIGMRFLNQKKWAKAAEYLTAAAHVNSRNPFLWMKLGQANERLGLTQAALDAFNAAQQIDPMNNEVDGEVRKLTSKSLPSRIFRRIFK